MVPPHRRAGGGLEPAGRALEPAGRALESAGRPGGGTEEKINNDNGAFLVCGGTIGHRLLWGCCPISTKLTVIQLERNLEAEETADQLKLFRLFIALASHL